MIVELVAIVGCSAASSWVTYELVTRHLSAHFDELLQKISSDTQVLKSHADWQSAHAEARLSKGLGDLQQSIQQTNAGVIEQQVKQEIKNKLSVATVETCTSCKRLVARFESQGDGAFRCLNCIPVGK